MTGVAPPNEVLTVDRLRLDYPQRRAPCAP